MRKNKIFGRRFIVFTACLIFTLASIGQNGMVVLQTDFGLKDGAVSEMKGVLMQVDAALRVFDLTHEIPAYNIWDAAYRLDQTIAYWPKGTVFVSVVDPGVGSARKGVVAETLNGYFIVTPDNGTLTFVAEHYGIRSVREIDERVNRLPGSNASNTFHGRDVFAYTAGRLSSGKISYRMVGPLLGDKVQRFAYQQAVLSGTVISGNIPALDVQYGNVWTNISDSLLKKAGIHEGDKLKVKLLHGAATIYETSVPLVRTFSEVPDKNELGYINSLLNFSIALNMGNFASAHNIESGADWHVELRKE